MPADTHLLRKMIGKYGIIDMHFSAPKHLIESEYERGVSLVRSLGLGDHEDIALDPEDSIDAFATSCGKMVLDDIAKELSRDLSFFMVLLKTDMQYPADTTEMVKQKFALMRNLPDTFFPKDFDVVDAWATNSEVVWFKRHFYL